MAVVVWLRRDVVLAVHRRQILEHGGPPGLREEALLESALARPRNLAAYQSSPPDMAALAAAYAYGIAQNHPFVDGNKRTALVVCILFLALNGFDLTARNEERYHQFMALAAGEAAEEALADWIRNHMKPSQSSNGDFTSRVRPAQPRQ